MSYTLEQFAADIHETLKADPGPGGQEKVLDYVRKALKDDDFVAANVPASLPEDRNVIYQDEELGFLICAHNNPGAKKGYPHDHGSTWAIYGQAVHAQVARLLSEVCVCERRHSARPPDHWPYAHPQLMCRARGAGIVRRR